MNKKRQVITEEKKVEVSLKMVESFSVFSAEKHEDKQVKETSRTECQGTSYTSMSEDTRCSGAEYPNCKETSNWSALRFRRVLNQNLHSKGCGIEVTNTGVIWY